MHDGELFNDTRVQVALSMMNRHGLIAGATGTGKTKTLQLLAGQLSKAGVPGVRRRHQGRPDRPGRARDDDATRRSRSASTSMGWTFAPSGHPVEFLSLSGKLGAQVRATVHSFGPLLLGKVLDLNETQTSILALIFKYCDDNDLPLLDLKDLAATLKFLASDEGKPILADYGGMSTASVGVLLRSIVVLEQEGADVFFGEPEFDVDDLLRTTPEGAGHHQRPRAVGRHGPAAAVLDVHALDAGPAVREPARGGRPAEAQAVLLLRRGAPALRRRVGGAAWTRSSGRRGSSARRASGVYFVTQAPTDVPSPVLAQLGNRVQHALRAFTPDDADALRKTARTFPTTEFYDVEKTITSLGTGEALVTVLSPKGVPTPLAATRLLAARLADGADRGGRVPRAHRDEPVRRRSTARPSTATAPTSGSPPRIAAARAASVAATRRRRCAPAWTRRRRPG